jgi:hypothetical protein
MEGAVLASKYMKCRGLSPNRSVLGQLISDGYETSDRYIRHQLHFLADEESSARRFPFPERSCFDHAAKRPNPSFYGAGFAFQSWVMPEVQRLVQILL